MPQKIIRLPEEVINRIAAGEVVENPAAIVKEMIENSLDAGASQVGIWIEEGGKKRICIEDDGCGMSREDAVLCLERHATSKIRTEQDLQQLSTMGFRGEALAAIASISLLEIASSDGEQGTRVRTEGGAISAIEPCARNRGTTIEVRSLFFNVPARKKFLKSTSANVAQISRIVETIALAHPAIGFSLYFENKIALEVSPQEHKKRIEEIIGSLPHEVQAEGIWGVLAPAEEAKVQRRGQYLFVNKRPVFSPLISKAVKAGYGTRIAEHAYPSFVLFLSIPSEQIDVNVHPQKKEIRFADEAKIFRRFEQAAASVFDISPSFTESLIFRPPSFSLGTPEPLGLSSPTREHPLSFDFSAIAKPIAVIEGFFLLQKEELLLVDLSAARARVLSESLKEKTSDIQSLMWPIEVIVDDENAAEELQAMGIECRWIGKRTLAIDALPSLLDASDFTDFLKSWREEKQIDAAINRYVRGKRKHFSIDEALFLWKQLQKCKENRYAPWGQMIWRVLDGNVLQKILES